jgi:predicted dithiol-disulfide oxidoreductase (DUF899 family)
MHMAVLDSQSDAYRRADLGEDDRRPYTGDPRGIDLLSPVWHVFDILPTGRGGWYPTN